MVLVCASHTRAPPPPCHVSTRLGSGRGAIWANVSASRVREATWARNFITYLFNIIYWFNLTVSVFICNSYTNWVRIYIKFWWTNSWIKSWWPGQYLERNPDDYWSWWPVSVFESWWCPVLTKSWWSIKYWCQSWRTASPDGLEYWWWSNPDGPGNPDWAVTVFKSWWQLLW